MVKMSDSDIEIRLKKLEDAVFGTSSAFSAKSKQIALSEISRSPLLKNGQQKVAAIVGYHELISQDGPIAMPLIKADWIKAKFSGKCDPKLLERSIIDGLVREVGENTYDLTQKGESFFEDIVKRDTSNG